jgi:hypothetical protein
LDRNQRIGVILMPTSNPLVRAAGSLKCNSEESTGQQLGERFPIWLKIPVGKEAIDIWEGLRLNPLVLRAKKPQAAND